LLPWLYKKSHTCIGLDISPDAVKLLQLRKEKTDFILEQCALAPLPAGAIEDGKIKHLGSIRQAVNTVVQQTHTYGLSVALALPAHSVFMQRIQLPASLHLRECEAEISSKLKYYLSGLTDELCFDFMILTTDDYYHDILIVASRLEQLNAYLSTINQAGLHSKIVDVDSYALMRAAYFMLAAEPLLDKQTIACLEVNINISQLFIFQQQHLIFNHLWQTEQGLSQEQQVDAALQLCLSTHCHLQIHHLIISGMCIPFTALHTFKIHYADPFKKIHFPDTEEMRKMQQCAMRFQLCFGLALRSAYA
jgi:type IV pilus assembly protein PilM